MVHSYHLKFVISITSFSLFSPLSSSSFPLQGWGMVRVEKPSLGPGKIIEQLAPWETFQVLGPHSGVDICDSIMIKRQITLAIIIMELFNTCED